jgi:hypothetical protein
LNKSTSISAGGFEMVDMLAAALDYAKRGVPVFPTDPGSKHPLTPHGFKDASFDEKQIRAWWAQWPNAMIGMPTGTRTNTFVFDVDLDPAKGIDGPKSLAELTAKHGSLPPTLSSKTPRGGTQFFFLWNGADIRNSSSKIGAGLDIRGEGGYVVLPPSVRADGTPYQWHDESACPVEAPQWLIDKILKRSPRDKVWARRALEEECAAVTAAPPGTRNDRLNTAAFNLFQLVASGALDENDVISELYTAAILCGLVEDDGEEAAWKTIYSGANAGRVRPRYRPTNSSSNGGGQPILITATPSTGNASGAASPAAPSGSPGPAPSPIPSPTPSPAAPTLPKILLIEGKLPEIIDEAEAALIAAKLHIYQRGDLVVRPIKLRLKAANSRDTFAWELVPVTKPYAVETFTRVARFEKMDHRVGGFVPKNCPDLVAETYLSRAGHWRIPILLGIINTPFLRVDGSLCERPGYDRASALLFIPERQSFPAIPNAPTREQALEALNYVDAALLAEFPFVQKVDRAVMLSALLTAFDRRSMATAPLHGFTSPTHGTGKSLLVDIISMLTAGQPAPVIAQGRNEEELEKRLGSALLCSDQIISIDNCLRELTSDFLCQALTQQQLKIRVLGYSRHVNTPITSTFFATGNNLTIGNDLTRRTLLCQLDAEVERPELRSFRSNVVEVVHAERGRLVCAALTILRAWHVARMTIGVDPLGSFEDWSYRIRQPLLWLDQPDPCDSIEAVRENDPFRAELGTVLMQWKEKLGVGAKHTVQQVIARAVPDPDFYGALMMVAASKQGGGISNDRLGRYLGRNNGKIVGRLKLMKVGNVHGYLLWSVINV